MDHGSTVREDFLADGKLTSYQYFVLYQSHKCIKLSVVKREFYNTSVQNLSLKA
jgi:hypothetical protein